MVNLLVVNAAGSSQRRLLEEIIREYEREGYVLAGSFDGKSWVELLVDGRSGGLFEDRRIIVAESAETMGTLDADLVSLAEPSRKRDTLCILLYSEDPSRYLPRELLRKLEVRKAEKIPPWTDARVAWMQKQTSRGGAARWTTEAMRLLAEWVEDPEELRKEMEKLEQAAGEAGVTEELVRKLCLDEGGKLLLKLLDGLCHGDIEDVLSSLSRMRDKEEPLRVISALHKRMRYSMYLARYGQQKGKKLVMNMGAKPYQVKQANAAASRFSAEGLSRFVQDMVKTAFLAKTSSADVWDHVEIAALRLLAADTKRRAAKVQARL
ncbi:MAG TPA: hypothetical protein DCE03_05170 [Synergistaceae bacterium]|jgi:DNA polymerase-3 subunit delta|nr:MAG: DNA polymerase III, delta subunit [Synergistales bacterium 53_16]KUL05133.1 MAG: DNA polymerase III, delta subunit [Synergistales bacterium 54_9]MDK2845682.1 polymerase subunit delta [Synergistales bacterium]HAA47859.1 hypothetical protein [Synergistaceae bacterium]MDN5335993.1 polymerase subunit delta [Synergistales bacterium]